MRLIFGLLLAFAVPAAALAETAWVTDRLRLGIHRAPDTSDHAFRTLESGQAVEILTKDRYYARVKLPDGTVGYVKAAYLVSEKPAVLIVEETRAANDELRRQLEKTKAQFASPAATIAALEQQVSEQQASLAESEVRVAALTEDNQRIVERQKRYRYSVPLSWVAGALAACLLAGFLGGLFWLDYRSRQRHGGIRVY